jgi:hypothetical protein
LISKETTKWIVGRCLTYEEEQRGNIANLLQGEINPVIDYLVARSLRIESASSWASN